MNTLQTHSVTYYESDEEESENFDYEYDEDDLEELNKIFNDHEEEVLSQNKPKETKVRNSVSRVQDFMLQLQSKFRDIYTKYPDYFLGKNLVIDEQLIKFAGRIFFLQYNPAKPAKRGILVRACVDTFTNFILSMDLYAASQTVPKGETKTLDVIKRLIDFPKQPNCTLFIMVQLTQLSILNQQGLNMLELLDQVDLVKNYHKIQRSCN
ncbi:Transposase_IS4 [Hexamita inflata]|uniref:Transposase IS4 n=1 Tax=Hexamita inflata TaxID=28002 RepID=A0AA86PVZ6_9EUKA|nr:Transposase IS4 [Hexamita inflata]